MLLATPLRPCFIAALALLFAETHGRSALADAIFVRADAAGANDGTSWTNAFTDLQAALASAETGDEIRVGQGTYKPALPGGSRETAFELRPGVVLRGGYAGAGVDPDARDPALYVTRLSGDINGAQVNSSYHVVRAIDVDSSTVLDGFVVCNGHADGLPPHDNGAGIYLLNASPQILNCTISDNLAGRVSGNFPPPEARGGGVYCEGGTPVFRNCRIERNESLRWGGGIYCLRAAPTFIECDVNSNETRTSGGGVYFNQCTAMLQDCRISENMVDHGSGGGMTLIVSQVTITDCQLANNHLRTGSGAGAIVGGSSSAVFSRCVISSNSSLRSDGSGGGVFCNRGSVTLFDCEIADNIAGEPNPDQQFAGGSGGGICCMGDASLTMANCNVRNNRAGDSGHFGSSVSPPPGGNGGGIALRVRAVGRIMNCTLAGNRAGTGGSGQHFGGDGGNGGGISVESASSLLIHGSLFQENRAGQSGVDEDGSPGYGGGDGGGLYVQEAICEVTNSTFVENAVGAYPFGSGGAASGAEIVMANCILWRNSRNQISSSVSVRFSLVQDGAAGKGNISADPRFSNATADNFHLAPFSPCIDAGENASVPADSLDMDADGDTTEPAPFDLDGNQRFRDDPGMSDTGLGAPPFVDMGAYEFRLISGCTGDLDGDGVVGMADLAILLSNVGRIGDAGVEDGDLNGNHNVESADLALLLARFGQSC